MSNKEKVLQTEKKPGLSIGEIKELNSLTTLNPDEKAAKSKRLAELRSIYAGNEYALRQLDIFDGNSEYNQKKTEYENALRSHNAAKEAEISAWFDVHYPDLKT
jgi:hypothetical protein